MFEKQSNSKGFTLAEIMVAAGLLGVLSVGVVNMVSNINKSSKRATQIFSVEQEIRQISELLKNKEICEATVSDPRTGITLTSPGTATPATLSSLDADHVDLDFAEIKDSAATPNIYYQVYDVDGAPGANGLLDNEYGSRDSQVLQLQRLMLQDWTDVPGETFTANDGTTKRVGNAAFRVVFKKGRASTSVETIKKTSFGSATISRTFNLKVIVDEATGNIESCFTSSDSYVEASCTALGGHLDGNGQCVEIQARNDVAAAVQRPALEVGGANSDTTAVGDLADANHRPPLSITRVNNNWGTAGAPATPAGQRLELDDNEIQSFAGAAGATLFVNKVGGDVDIGIGGTNLYLQGIISNTGPGAPALTITDDVNITGNTVNTGTMRVTQDFTADANALVSGNLSVTGNATVNTNLQVDGNSQLGNGTADVTNTSGVLNVGTDLNVAGNTDITGNLTADGNVVLGTGSTNTVRVKGRLMVDEIAKDDNTVISSLNQIRYGTGVLDAYASPHNDTLVTSLWVRTRIAKTLDPSGTIGADVLASIASVSAATKERAATDGINSVDCNEESWTITGDAAGTVSHSWSTTNKRCERVINVSSVDKCDTAGNCAQVCIDSVCKTSWNDVIQTVSQTYNRSASPAGRGCWVMYPFLWTNYNRNFLNGSGYSTAAVSYSSAVGVYEAKTCGADAFMSGFARINAGRLRNMWYPVCCHSRRY